MGQQGDPLGIVRQTEDYMNKCYMLDPESLIRKHRL